MSSPSLGYNYNPFLIYGIRLAWGLAALATVVLYIIALPVEFQRLSSVGVAFYGVSPGAQEWGQAFAVFRTALEGLKIALYVAVSIFVFYRARGDWVAQLISLQLLLLVSATTFAFYTLSLEEPIWQLPVAILTLSNWFTLTFTMFLFPNGRYVPVWTRRAALPIAVLIVAVGYVAVWGIPNPAFPDVLVLWLIALMLLPAQVYRYRFAATPVQRQQTKWIVYGMVLTLTWGAFGSVVDFFVFPALPPEGIAVVIYGALSRLFLWWLPLIAFPVCVALAVTQSRLWEIDLVINRSLVTGAITIGLGLGFLLIFTGLQALFQLVMGAQQSIVAVTAAAVAIAALFNPLRDRLRDFVDHNIFNLEYGLNEVRRDHPVTSVENPGELTGQQVGGYQITDVIGRGGMGEVYRGVNNGRTAAIKLLSSKFLSVDEAEMQKRFAREAQTLSTLNHPNIVSIYDYGKSGDLHYIAMEYIDGVNLHDYLVGQFNLSLDETLPIAGKLAAALDYAHGHGYIHRDIKPANIMLRHGTNDPVLMDFGIVKMKESLTQLTGDRSVGTVEYMAPEQFTTTPPTDHRADIYALAGVVYRMLTGHLVFEGGTAHIMFAHIQQPPPDPRDLIDLPPNTARAIMQALAKNPDDRFSSAGEFVQAMRL